MTCKELAEAVKKENPTKYEQIESQYGSGVVAAYIAWENQADDSETETTIDGWCNGILEDNLDVIEDIEDTFVCCATDKDMEAFLAPLQIIGKTAADYDLSEAIDQVFYFAPDAEELYSDIEEAREIVLRSFNAPFNVNCKLIQR